MAGDAGYDVEESRIGSAVKLPHHRVDGLQRISLQPEGVSLFERHPPHFSTGVYSRHTRPKPQPVGLLRCQREMPKAHRIRQLFKRFRNFH